MFQISTIQDTIRVPPHDLSLPLLEAIKRQIEKLFFNKVSTLILCFLNYYYA